MNNYSPNIYDAYLYKFKKFILAFSYTPGFDFSPIVSDISKSFALRIIHLDNNNYDDLNNKVNTIINENIQTKNNHYVGILIHGLNFDQSKIKFQIDLQLHFSLSSQLFLKLNPKSSIDDYNNLKNVLNNNKINKYYNIKSDPTIELNDSVFDKIIDFIEFKVYGKNYEELASKNKQKNFDKYVTDISKPTNSDETTKSDESDESDESDKNNESDESDESD